MPNNYVLFNGVGASGNYDLWVTDGTAAGTSELSVVGANAGGLNPNPQGRSPGFAGVAVDV
jgi:ELWxxDGT repeat protein